MDNLPTISNYWENIKAHNLEQYKQSTKLVGLIQLVMGMLDRCEAGLQELKTLFDLSIAIGAQLDLLGSLINNPRNGRTDNAYRLSLIQWFGAQRQGTPEDIIRQLLEITGASKVEYIPEYPAGFWVVNWDRINQVTQLQLDAMSPAGVQGFIGCLLVDANDDFIVDATGDYILVVGPCEDSITYLLDEIGNNYLLDELENSILIQDEV